MLLGGNNCTALSNLATTTSINLGDATEDYIDIDNNKHIWYNTFNKWSWTKFENGVIKIETDERRV